MKTAAVIQARMGSTRLPGKVMKPIIGKPMIQLMIERVKRAEKLDEIIIATSTNPIDDVLEKLAAATGVKCYRGSETDVLDRVLKAAQHFKVDVIVELWGDAPVMDPEVIDRAVEYYAASDYDCLGTVLKHEYPWGIGLLIFTTKILAAVSAVALEPVYREHVSNYIYEHTEKYKIGYLPCPPELRRPELRLAVDEEADYLLIKHIYEHFAAVGKPDFNTRDIIELAGKNQKMFEINKHVKQRKAKQNVVAGRVK